MSNELFSLLKSSATACLAITEKAGRGLLARCQLHPYEAILSEGPIVCAPAPANFELVCSSCLQPIPRGVCGSIATTSGSTCSSTFCSAACRSKALQQHGPAGFPMLQQYCLATGEKFPLLAAQIAAGFVYSAHEESLEVRSSPPLQSAKASHASSPIDIRPGCSH